MSAITADAESPWAKPVSREPNNATWLQQIASIADRQNPDQGDPEILPPHIIQDFRRLRAPETFPDDPQPAERHIQWLERSLAFAFADSRNDRALPHQISWSPDGNFLLFWRIGNRFFDLELNADNHDGILLAYNINQAEEAWERPVHLNCAGCWHNLAEMTLIAEQNE